MSYRILLFDLDDTLLDFGANEIDSLNILFHYHGYTFSDELFGIYNSVKEATFCQELIPVGLIENLKNPPQKFKAHTQS